MKSIKAGCLAGALVLACLVAEAQQGTINLSFSGTDVAQVLRAIGVRTGASIVYSGQDKLPITLNVSATTVDEAVRSAVSAAGLAYRKIDRTYIVAKPEAMRQALQPYSYKVTFTTVGDVAEAAKLLEDALPQATIKVVGGKILFTGVAEDIATAKRLLKTQTDRGPSVTNVVNLLYADPKAVGDMLQSTYPSLKISPIVSKSYGSLVVTGPQTEVNAALAIAAKIDVPSKGGAQSLTYRVYNIRYSSAPSLLGFLKDAAPEVECYAGPEAYSPFPPAFNPLSTGATTTNSTGGQGGGGGAGGNGGGGTASGYISRDPAQDPYQPMDRAKALVLRGPDEVVAAAIRLLEQVDVKPQQVVIEVKVIDTTPQFSQALGLNWDWTRLGFYELPKGTGITSTSGKIGGDFTDFITRPAGFGQLSRVPWSFEAFLKASVKKNETKILASPNIMVTDNDQANFFVGDTLRVQLSTSGALGSQTTQVQEFPIGIIMILRPRVNVDGNITLRIHPVVSSITAINGDGLPQTSEREADTNVVTRDGETIVIGGLIRDEDTRTVTEIPILSKLPIVGELFRTRTRDKNRKEVLVFITTHIVKDGEAKPNPFGPVPPAEEKKAPPKKNPNEKSHEPPRA